MRSSGAFLVLLPRLVRLIPWWHLALGLAAAFALASTRRGPFVNADDIVFGLRVGAVALAASAAFVFDDPAASLTEGKPLPLWLQRSGRLLLVLSVVAAGWALLVDWMAAATAAEAALTVASARYGVWVEMVAMLGVVWAVATLFARTGRDGGGLVAAPALLALVVVFTMLPPRWAMFPSPALPPLEDGGAASAEWALWMEAHRRWMVLGAVSWAGVVLGLRSSARDRTPRLGQRLRTAHDGGAP